MQKVIAVYDLPLMLRRHNENRDVLGLVHSGVHHRLEDLLSAEMAVDRSRHFRRLMTIMRGIRPGRPRNSHRTAEPWADYIREFQGMIQAEAWRSEGGMN
jgi:hypothetical protein